MTHVAYLVAGYGITTVAIGAYAAWVVRRERSLSARLGTPSSGSERGSRAAAG